MAFHAIIPAEAAAPKGRATTLENSVSSRECTMAVTPLQVTRSVGLSAAMLAPVVTPLLCPVSVAAAGRRRGFQKRNRTPRTRKRAALTNLETGRMRGCVAKKVVNPQNAIPA